MLLPYYVAALNIEHAYFELTESYEAFEGLCFVDTLELAEADQQVLSFMTEANTARVERQKKTPITVIIGNPPYNVGQLNENDNNKNRRYPIIDTHHSRKDRREKGECLEWGDGHATFYRATRTDRRRPAANRNDGSNETGGGAG
jgi:predicted helicase